MDKFDFKQLDEARQANVARNGAFHDALLSAAEILEHELANTEPYLLAGTERRGLRVLYAELHGRLFLNARTEGPRRLQATTKPFLRPAAARSAMFRLDTADCLLRVSETGLREQWSLANRRRLYLLAETCVDACDPEAEIDAVDAPACKAELAERLTAYVTDEQRDRQLHTHTDPVDSVDSVDGAGEVRHTVSAAKTFNALAADMEQRRRDVKEERPSVAVDEPRPRGEW